MRHDCDHIRRRALEHGEGSAEYDVWVRHSRHCPECRNEICIQGLLNSERQNRPTCLSGESMARLVQLADQRYRGGRHGHWRSLLRFVRWSGRIACMAAVLFVMVRVFPSVLMEIQRGTSWGGPEGGEAAVQDVLAASPATADEPDAEVEGADGMVEDQRQESVEAGTVYDWELEDSIQETRRRIMTRRNVLDEPLHGDGF